MVLNFWQRYQVNFTHRTEHRLQHRRKARSNW